MNKHLLIASSIVVILVSILFFHYYTDVGKKIKYEVSLMWVHYTQPQWWTLVIPKLYLGAIPLKNEGHLSQIKALGVTSIIALVEDFELEEGWFDTPVTIDDWSQTDINVIHIKAVDFWPLNDAEFDEAVNSLNTLILDDKTVYVHCKAGRGRIEHRAGDRGQSNSCLAHTIQKSFTRRCNQISEGLETSD